MEAETQTYTQKHLQSILQSFTQYCKHSARHIYKICVSSMRFCIPWHL